MSKKKIVKICSLCKLEFENYWKKHFCKPCHDASVNRICKGCTQNFTVKSPLAKNQFCGNSCANKINLIKANKAFKEIHGDINPSQLQYVKEKKKATTFKNYGVENPMQLKEIQEKARETQFKKYDGKYAFNTEAAKNTMIEKYGVTIPYKNEAIKERGRQTNQERYGVDNPFQHKETMEKVRAKRFEETGYEYASQNPLIKEKIYLANLANSRKNKFISSQEVMLMADLKLKSGYSKIVRKQVDGLDTNIKIAVELDGWYWHKDKMETDRKNSLALLNENYKVIRIRMHSINGKLKSVGVNHTDHLELFIQQEDIENRSPKYLDLVKNINKWLDDKNGKLVSDKL